jgi:hypothetical protein
MRYTINQGIQNSQNLTKKIIFTLIASASILAIAAATQLSAGAVSCTSVSTSKGPLTAAQVGGNVSGEVDATGCDIGAYFNSDNPGSVKNAEVHDANQYGVFVDGNVAGDTTVDITNSRIYNIGNHTGGVFDPNGNQTGVGIYYYGFGTLGSVAGTVKSNQVTDWQKGGIVCNGENADCVIENNNVGESASNKDKLAPNGIQIGFGALGTVQRNNVEGGTWCGPSNFAATAILLYDQADGTVVKQNNIRGDSDVGIYVFGGETVVNNNKVFEDKNAGDCNANGYDWGIGNWGDPSEVTNNKVKGFDVAYDGVTGGKNKTIPGPQKSNPSF